jgi:hypothetical protein
MRTSFPEEEPTSAAHAVPRTGGAYLTATIEDPALVIDLVNFIHTTRRTGLMAVTVGAVRRSIYFHQGAVIAGASNQSADRFGEIVCRMGLVSREALDAALAEVGPERKIGTVLLARGLISTRDLWKILRAQIEEILFAILLVDSGEVTLSHFDPGQVPSRTALNTQHVLLEGLRRKDEMEHLRGQIPAGDRRIVKTRLERNVTLTENERRIYDLVDGARTVGELLDVSLLGELEGVRVLHHLLKVGLVAEGGRAAILLPSEGGERSFEDILNAFNGAVLCIHDALVASGEAGLVSLGVDSFFDEIDPELAELFDSVVPAPDGRLPTDRIFANLKLTELRDKRTLLRRGLSDYVQFLLFLARENLDFERVEALAREVSEMLRGWEL